MTEETRPKRKYRKKIENPRRVNRGNWDAIPLDVRLTLAEAAAIIGIGRNSLRAAYAGVNPPCKLPQGFAFHTENGRAVFLIRHRVPQETK
jgi:hypothetical protein